MTNSPERLRSTGLVILVSDERRKYILKGEPDYIKGLVTDEAWEITKEFVRRPAGNQQTLPRYTRSKS